jgi:hypothetical protein
LDDQKKSLLTGREKIEKGNRVLKTALTEAHDTVAVGIDTLGTMDDQTKRLGTINDKVIVDFVSFYDFRSVELTINFIEPRKLCNKCHEE